ncbi:5-carboxymethyl-2-hydroxymuconate Delta-isomerase [Vibrio sp. Isolate31]|uniref:5-carboxymethyl-2-hydroxymuconate Delta-isomerase n=1 Tax=unclassified Vibrio TaxID=2614977 RepID=UPI001EFC5BA5|nr:MULTISPECIES: 5-carboxymethyl-2-hydroxymuconate Delta-isomerase [unclassified Vibrio]MCG9554770.1 5-carboxymethyl-2-hydroxymuconate Delta-isomerase [Vibrio sp. Isolate32]MCG9601012.1 5-carboxymethyl-2-hydroxymuconate Delta-isomerase [Vibrio sp. Isolate31]
MPHFIMEFSPNVELDVDIPELLKVIHREAIDTCVFPKGGIRTRAVKSDYYLIADEDPNNRFIHLTAKVGGGRDLAVRQKAAERVFEVFCQFLEPVFEKQYISIGFEMIELHPELNYKKNNIHQKLAISNNA